MPSCMVPAFNVDELRRRWWLYNTGRRQTQGPVHAVAGVKWGHVAHMLVPWPALYDCAGLPADFNMWDLVRAGLPLWLEAPVVDAERIGLTWGYYVTSAALEALEACTLWASRPAYWPPAELTGRGWQDIRAERTFDVLTAHDPVPRPY